MDVMTSPTRIKGPKLLKTKALQSFETSADSNEGTRRHTQLLRHRLLSTGHVLAVLFTSSRFRLSGEAKTVGKT